MRKYSIKNNRINSEVRKVVSAAVREAKDPRISLMTSVLECAVAPDLKTCKVYVSVIGSEEEHKKTIEGLKSAAGYIRSEIAHALNMRHTPELTFIADSSAEYAINISAKIDEIMEQDRRARAARGETEGETEDVF